MVLALAPELLLSYTPIFDVYSERGARIYSRLELLKYARLFLKKQNKTFYESVHGWGQSTSDFPGNLGSLQHQA